ncbi:MAG TPA: putative baseplate assembly protein [Candidatus Sulfopaludibacter sp.]|jgi:hypothetical protein|nr:putative baseplate assembly protein [Candidatus Sulfopaludibacter sp.]
MSTQYFCGKQQRKAKVLTALDGQGHGVLNGIDYLEVSSTDEKTLTVHFLFNLPGTAGAVPPSPAPVLTVANVVIDGGVRITGIQVTSVVSAANVLTVQVNAAGDYSTYTLRLVAGVATPFAPAGIDPQLSSVDFSFKVECPSDFDCKPVHACPPETLPQAEIDYLAKDYESFRQLVFDRMARTMPAWRETNPADIGVALVELLAYAGDQLSYYQDAVATEAYLGTARRRISVRRHARLLDYAIQEGVNARTWVCFEAGAGPDVAVPAGTTLLTQTFLPHGPISQDQANAAMSAGSLAFETMAAIDVHPELNQILFYTWSDDQCCLPQGATQATLLDTGAGPLLTVGDVLLFEEVLGPATGVAADADPAHRCVVRLTTVTPGMDPLNGAKVIEIAWDAADKLPFPMCLSNVSSKPGSPASPASLARGNMVLADHGLTGPLEALPNPITSPSPYRPRLQYTGLTFHVPYDEHAARLQPAAGILMQDPRKALPDIALLQPGGAWSVRGDLLNSGPTALDFVVEMENDGSANLRFGDGVLGAKPLGVLQASYRTGNGSIGNVGAESLAHVLATPASPFTGIVNVRNPLSAQGGADPETLDQVRTFAPFAFRTQERAVTVKDYATIAQRHPQVKMAKANLRWTGSWYTMFLTVDRKGTKPADAAFRTAIRNFLEEFRLAGYDLEIEAPTFIPLDIFFTVCVAPGYFRDSVRAALLDTFSNRILPNGQRGFFYPDHFEFGQAVYLSQLVAAAMRIPGVAWIDTNDKAPSPNHFKRWGQASHGETAAGKIEMANLEIARLDNDPSLPENGKIDFLMEGGL